MAKTLVIRTDTAQAEGKADERLRIVDGLTWTKGGCELRQRTPTAKQAALLQPKVVQVHSTAVRGDIYWYQASINGFIITGQMQRVK